MLSTLSVGVLGSPGGLINHKGQRGEGAPEPLLGVKGPGKELGVWLLLHGRLSCPSSPSPLWFHSLREWRAPFFHFGGSACSVQWSLELVQVTQLFVEVVQITHTPQLFWA